MKFEIKNLDNGRFELNVIEDDKVSSFALETIEEVIKEVVSNSKEKCDNPVFTIVVDED